MNRLLWRDSLDAEPGDGWDPDAGGIDTRAAVDRLRTEKTGLRLLLVVISSLFFLFMVAFIARSQMVDWQPLTTPLAPLAATGPLWLNSTLLLLASVALQGARMASRRGLAALTLGAFLLGGVFAVAFLLGQLWVWQRFAAWGYWLASNPANSFFYLLTGLHGLHLLGGLVAWGWTLGKFLRRVPLARLGANVELCALYWHYLLGLWLVLFALLTSTPETYQAIAALCGLR